jgi:hypothetical protein
MLTPREKILAPIQGPRGIVSPMKALMSPLAKVVLADPKAKVQMRAFLAAKSEAADASQGNGDDIIEVEYEGRTVRVKPTVVPRAA